MHYSIILCDTCCFTFVIVVNNPAIKSYCCSCVIKKTIEKKVNIFYKEVNWEACCCCCFWSLSGRQTEYFNAFCLQTPTAVARIKELISEQQNAVSIKA